MTIGWWSHSHDLRIASARIRGELVMRALRAAGTEVGWFDAKRPDEFKILVIGKRYDPQTIQVAAEAQRRGAKIIVDLCDNRFEYPDNDVELAQQSERLRYLLGCADHVVASTDALAEVIQQQCPQVRSLSVIGDLADDLGVIPTTSWQRLTAKIRLCNSLQHLQSLRRRGHSLLVWFGSHGGPYAESGMTDLLRIRSLLEALHTQSPIVLTIISNSAHKYRQHIQAFALPTRYEEWNCATFDPLLQAHDISLIPIGVNAFTRCKTDNRVVTSLLNDLAVVADDIPSYRPYENMIGLNDWEASLPQYINDRAKRLADISTGKVIARQLTDVTRITQQWQAVLSQWA